MGLRENTITNILGYENNHNDLILIAPIILFQMTPGFQIRIYIYLMGSMMKIWLILSDVLVFALVYLMAHMKALFLEYLCPVLHQQTILCLPLIFFQSKLFQNHKFNRGAGPVLG